MVKTVLVSTISNSQVFFFFFFFFLSFFLADKMRVAFANAKATHIFFQQKY